MEAVWLSFALKGQLHLDRIKIEQTEVLCFLPFNWQVKPWACAFRISVQQGVLCTRHSFGAWCGIWMPLTAGKLPFLLMLVSPLSLPLSLAHCWCRVPAACFWKLTLWGRSVQVSTHLPLWPGWDPLICFFTSELSLWKDRAAKPLRPRVALLPETGRALEGPWPPSPHGLSSCSFTQQGFEGKELNGLVCLKSLPGREEEHVVPWFFLFPFLFPWFWVKERAGIQPFLLPLCPDVCSQACQCHSVEFDFLPSWLELSHPKPEITARGRRWLGEDVSYPGLGGWG